MAAEECKVVWCSGKRNSRREVWRGSNHGTSLHSLGADLFVIQYSRAPVSADSVPAVKVIRGLPRPPKNLKIKEINSS
jgi:hypothetical protein